MDYEQQDGGNGQAVDLMALLRDCLDVLKSSTEPHNAVVLEDLEILYNCLEERENDFKMAAQIGQMLVQRNSELMEEMTGMKRDWEAEVNVQRSANNGLLRNFERLEEENSQLMELNDRSQALLAELRMKCDLLQRENVLSRELQTKAAEDASALKNQIRSLKLQAKLNAAYKDRVRSLSEEIEGMKTVLVESQEKVVSLQKMNNILVNDQARLKEAAGKDEVLEYEVSSLKEKIEALRKQKEVNKNLKVELSKHNEVKHQLDKSAEQIANLSEVVDSLMKANKFFQQKQVEDEALLAEANNTISTLRATIEQRESDYVRLKETAERASLSDEFQAKKKQDKENEERKGQQTDENRFELEKQLRKEIRAELADEIRAQLRKELEAEVERDIESRVKVEIERVRERFKKESEELRKQKEEEAKLIVQFKKDEGEEEEDEEKKKEKKAALVKALKASLSQDIFNLVYTEMKATPAMLSSLDEPLIGDLRQRVTRRLEDEMGIQKSPSASGVSPTDDGAETPKLEESPRKLSRQRSRSQVGSNPLPLPLHLSSMTTSPTVPSRQQQQHTPSALTPASAKRISSPNEDISAMAIFQKIANMENYLVTSPRKPLTEADKKWRRNSVTPMMLRRMVTAEPGLRRDVKAGGENDEAEMKEREKEAEAERERERVEREAKERERELKFSTLPSRFSEEQALLMQQLRESLKEEGSPAVSPTAAPPTDTQGMTEIKNERETENERGKEREREREREKEQEHSLEDLVTDEMMELRTTARIKLAAARTVEGEQESSDTSLREKDGLERGRADWIRKNSPAVTRKDTTLTTTNTTTTSTTQGAEEEEVEVTLQVGSPKSIRAAADALRDLSVYEERKDTDDVDQLREMALSLEGIDMKFNASVEQEIVGSPGQGFMSPKKKKQMKKRASTFNIRQARLQLLQLEEEMKKEEQEREKEKEKEEKEKEKGKDKVKKEDHDQDVSTDEAEREREIIKELYGNLRLDAWDDESENSDLDLSEKTRKDEAETMVPLAELKRFEREEKHFIKAICALRNKLDDANLRIMNKAMKEMLTFGKLIQLSDALIGSVTNEGKDLLKTDGLRNPSLACLAIDLLLEVCLLMHRCNDLSVGINQPTLEKLEEFSKSFAERANRPTTPRGTSANQNQQRKQAAGGGGFFSFFRGT